MTEIIKERIQKIRLNLIIIQGKSKQSIYKTGNVQKFENLQC